MSKKIIWLSVFYSIFLFGMLWAQCSPAGPFTNPLTGDQYCDPNDANGYFQCASDGQWVSYTCGNYGGQPGVCNQMEYTIYCSAAPTTCPVHSELGHGGNSNEQFCLPSYPQGYAQCDGQFQVWNTISCPSGQICEQSGTTSVTCVQNGGSSVCPPAGPFTNPLTGDQYCDPNNPNGYFQCMLDGQWASFPCGNYNGQIGVCNQLETTVYCSEQQSSACIDGTTRCNPDDNTYVQTCVNGTFVDSKACLNGCDSNTNDCIFCIDGRRRCNPIDNTYVQECINGSFADIMACLAGCDILTAQCREVVCTNPSGSNGDEACISNSIYLCQSGVWMVVEDCPSSQVCTVSGYDAYCANAQSGGSTGSGSSGGSGVGSGGGEVSACSSWSEWILDSSSTFSDTTNGESRQCTKSILKRWCIKSNGQYDYSKYESKESVDCSADSAETCDYVYDRSQKYADRSGNQCRECTRDIYVQQCMPSGEMNYDMITQKESCTPWALCDAKQSENNTQTGAGSQTQLQELMADYSLVFGVLILLLILIVGYTGWKMFSAKPEQE